MHDQVNVASAVHKVRGDRINEEGHVISNDFDD